MWFWRTCRVPTIRRSRYACRVTTQTAGVLFATPAATWSHRSSLRTTARSDSPGQRRPGDDRLVIDSSGNVTIQGQCTEVDGACADHVFEPDYNLMTLDELGAVVTSNRHLPNVPSTEEIRARGVKLQHFQGRLLEKVEELVLYTLQQQEALRALRRENGALSVRLEALERAASIQK